MVLIARISRWKLINYRAGGMIKVMGVLYFNTRAFIACTKCL